MNEFLKLYGKKLRTLPIQPAEKRATLTRCRNINLNVLSLTRKLKSFMNSLEALFIQWLRAAMKTAI